MTILPSLCPSGLPIGFHAMAVDKNIYIIDNNNKWILYKKCDQYYNDCDCELEKESICIQGKIDECNLIFPASTSPVRAIVIPVKEMRGRGRPKKVKSEDYSKKKRALTDYNYFVQSEMAKLPCCLDARSKLILISQKWKEYKEQLIDVMDYGVANGS